MTFGDKIRFTLFCGIASSLPVATWAQSCIAGATPTSPASEFVVNADGTVIQSKTKLMWMRCSLGQVLVNNTCTGTPTSFAWKSALEQGENFSFAGYDNWRLPNKNELATLVEYNCTNPSINTEVFPDTPAWPFWTSTPYVGRTYYAWSVNFSSGSVGNVDVFGSIGLRLVRDIDGSNGEPLINSNDGQPLPPEQQDEPYSDNSLIMARTTINDTGMTACATTTDLSECPVIEYPSQDAEVGRDRQASDKLLSKQGAGNAGFDFTKLDAKGVALDTTSNQWDCVRDNHTGLIWESKTVDPTSLRFHGNLYSWYEPDNSRNGGNVGTPRKGTCSGSDCDTASFVQEVNRVGLCGAKDWRIPTPNEILSIMDNSNVSDDITKRPGIDIHYFPNLQGELYWTSMPLSYDASAAWRVDIAYGTTSTGKKAGTARVILVRGGQ